jgi:hypothetical protein
LQKISDQLKAGEISLIEIMLEVAKAAKSRLETHLAKRRKCYAFKKAKN